MGFRSNAALLCTFFGITFAEAKKGVTVGKFSEPQILAAISVPPTDVDISLRPKDRTQIRLLETKPWKLAEHDFTVVLTCREKTLATGNCTGTIEVDVLQDKDDAVTLLVAIVDPLKVDGTETTKLDFAKYDLAPSTRFFGIRSERSNVANRKTQLALIGPSTHGGLAAVGVFDLASASRDERLKMKADGVVEIEAVKGGLANIRIDYRDSAKKVIDSQRYVLNLKSMKYEASSKSADDAALESAGQMMDKWSDEGRLNLQGIYVSEKGYFQERDSYAGDFSTIKFSPGRGNRYTYFLAPSGVTETRANDTVEPMDGAVIRDYPALKWPIEPNACT